MSKYYISPFDFFYARNENLGSKFSKSAFNESYTYESDSFDLITILSLIAKGFEENENEFINAYIDISDLIKGVLKRELYDFDE